MCKDLPEHPKNAVAEVRVDRLRPGMIRAWNHGHASTIESVEKTSPRSRTYAVGYRALQPRPDGQHNTVTLRHVGTGYLPILKLSMSAEEIERSARP